jgi:cytochrome c oxidase subunit IV
MEHEKPHIIPYRFYVFILLALIAFTAVSVLVTRINLGPLSTFTALALASIKSVLVLAYFMHLRFDKKIFAIMFGIVALVFIAILFFTVTFDYSFRS